MNIRLVCLLIIAPSMVLASGLDSVITNGVHQLETNYIEDCAVDATPHGFYGAFFQPCEFQFRQKILDVDDGDACLNNASTLVSKPVPMHWFFNSTLLDEKQSWDSWSSDDFPSAEELLLWPDQCVGVTPRCYGIDDIAIHDTLTRIFSSGIPEDATHVQVDCRVDASEASRVVYTVVERFEKIAAIWIAWMVTLVLVSVVLSMWCIYACARLCCCRDQRRLGSYPLGATKPGLVPRSSEYEAIEGDTPEKVELIKQGYVSYVF